VLIRTF